MDSSSDMQKCFGKKTSSDSRCLQNLQPCQSVLGIAWWSGPRIDLASEAGLRLRGAETSQGLPPHSERCSRGCNRIGQVLPARRRSGTTCQLRRWPGSSTAERWPCCLEILALGLAPPTLSTPVSWLNLQQSLVRSASLTRPCAKLLRHEGCTRITERHVRYLESHFEAKFEVWGM